MTATTRRQTILAAYAAGLRRCPCCHVQLVWRSPLKGRHPPNVATIDHIIPKCQGGSDMPDNLFVMCATCNNKRGSRCFLEFLTKTGVDPIQAKARMEKAILAGVRFLLCKSLHNQTPKTNRPHLHTLLRKAAALGGGTLPPIYALLPLSAKHKIAYDPTHVFEAQT